MLSENNQHVRHNTCIGHIMNFFDAPETFYYCSLVIVSAAVAAVAVVVVNIQIYINYINNKLFLI